MSGVKFNDADQDGIKDTPDAPLVAWEIDVTGTKLGVPYSTAMFTDSGGNWSVNLDRGTSFTACEVLQTGWIQDFPAASPTNPAVTTIGGVNCWTGTVPIANTSGYDFGNFQPSNLTVTKTATPAFTRTYAWSISKSVDSTEIDTSSGGSAVFHYTVVASQTGSTDSAWAVNGTITVTNQNLLFDFTGVNVTDSIDNSGSCSSITGGSNNGVNETILRNSSVVFTYTCTFGSNPGSGTNTAKATWNQGINSASGKAGYTFGSPTNPVNQTIHVTDTVGGNLGSLTATDPLATAATQTFTYSRTITAPTSTCATYDNTASITETSQSSKATVKVCGASPLTVAKNAGGTYTSAITKSVDKTKVEQAGGSITLNYTVKVTESGWTVSGNIMVTNPNDWESITANVGDSLSDSGGVCTVTGGSGAVVAKSAAITLPYTCSFASPPSSASGTNTAAATWNASAAHTSSNTNSGTASYSFSSLTVTDCWGSATSCTSTTLGTIAGNIASKSYTYAHTVTNAAPGTCQEYDNKATITETKQMAQASAIQCNTKTGALTMGFWKNSNGQGIISGQAKTGTCASATWLRQFNPFMDLSSTATCSQVATYVSNAIGAATCTSSTGTCNSMLKAQMLATALDVYFSDPALGGNKIGAYNGLGLGTPPLGGVAIDLSHVCSMTDSSSGSTCNGTYEDARPEFGIATPALGTTVLQMLSYANYPSSVNGNPVSNIGGTTWYKQIKNPNQVYAKDAFDNFNNQIAGIAPAGTTASPSF